MPPFFHQNLEPEVVYIYTDGSCEPNPGRGGWGAVIIDGKEIMRLSGSQPDATNNQMELTAAVKALEWLPKRRKVKLFSDSRYVVNGCNDWVEKWMRRGWKTSAGKLVANKDLWKKLTDLLYQHYVTVEWIEGHNGDNPWNAEADQLAAVAREYF